MNGPGTDPETRKRLGQYFTGAQLARLLATLADAKDAASILDPMVGAGDMLAGAVAAGARPKLLAGAEIDPQCIATARQRLTGPVLKRSTLVEGDAFRPSTLGELPQRSWDLVITNPPYVRYQSTAAGNGARFPSAAETRSGLSACLRECEALSDEDEALFQHLASSYSGLADLAVPAWLLCAALVAPGGTLAMIVPDTWLSRDYASPIQYLLARCFDVRFVVRDTDAAWFDDALVRTTLVVAHRVACRESAFNPPSDAGYLDIALRRRAVDSRSPVGAAYNDAEDPDDAFARDSNTWLDARGGPSSASGAVTWVPASHTAETLLRATRNKRWLKALEPGLGSDSAADNGPTVPLRIKRAIHSTSPSFECLEDLGWRVGQGLRTGANAFFYGAATDEGAGKVTMMTSGRLGGAVVGVSTDAALPVVRNQADLPKTLTLRARSVTGRVLVLADYALPEDLERDGDAAPYRVIDDDLARFIRNAARTNVGSDEQPRFVPELSAVVTNAHPARRNGTVTAARYWYQLPPLAARHRPELLLARVNHGQTRTFINPRRALIVDANFSTLWREAGECRARPHAMLAVMNSSWVRANLELTGTVLGGGALKVEATHLRRLAIPRMTNETWGLLDELGRRLARIGRKGDDTVIRQIDEAVGQELAPRCSEHLASELREIATAAAAARQR